MKTYKVGICDKDLDYATALMDFINADKSRRLSMMVFSSYKAIKDYLSVQDLDLVITDDISACDKTEEGYEYQGVKTVPLSQYRDSSDGWKIEKSDSTFIFKYQDVELICRSLSQILTEKKKDPRNLSTVVAVFSPLGRCGKSRLARALAADDGVRGGLYVSMENYANKINHSSNNILYLIKSKSPELEEVIAEQTVCEDGIQVLKPSTSYLDTLDVLLEDMEMLVSILLKSGRYTTIVFDFGSAAISDMRILGLFETIYMPVLRDDISLGKIEVFLSVLKEMGLRNVITKIVKVDVPDAEPNSEEMVRTLWELSNDGGDY